MEEAPYYLPVRPNNNEADTARYMLRLSGGVGFSTGVYWFYYRFRVGVNYERTLCTERRERERNKVTILIKLQEQNIEKGISAEQDR